MAEKARNFFLFVLFLSIPFSIAGGDFAVIGLYLTTIYIFFKKEEKWESVNILWGMGIFLAGAVLSSAFSGDAWSSFGYFRKFWRLGLVLLVFFSLRKRKYDGLLRLALIVSGIVALYALFQHRTGMDFLRVTDFNFREEYKNLDGSYPDTWNAIGLFSHHLTYGGVSMLLFSLFLPPVFNPSFSLKERLFWGTGAALNMLGIIVAMGRSLWMGAALAVIVIAFFQFNKKTFALVSLLLALMLTGIGFTVYQSGYRCKDKVPHSLAKRIVCFDIKSNFDRVAMWEASANIVKDHPLLGLGANRDEEMVPYYRETSERYNYEFQHHPKVGVHNIYFQTWIDFGLLGLAGYLIWWFTVIGGITLAIAKEPINANRDNSVLLGSLAGLLGIMAAGFFENNFRDGEVQIAILTIMGLSLSIMKRKKLKRKN